MSKRYRKALSGTTISSAAFDSIHSSATPASTKDWAEEEGRAQREHVHNVAAMDIYDIKMKRREFDLSTLVFIDNWL